MTFQQNREISGAAAQKRWLVTGAAGFIGSHIVCQLLETGAEVCALDNFATGRRDNILCLREAANRYGPEKLSFIEGDVRDYQVCRRALEGIDVVLHQAALGSVPRSVNNPAATISANILGFTVLVQAARDRGIRRIVYASSSSVYGDSDTFEKHEDLPLAPRSPYAVSKAAMEQLANACASLYGMTFVGLRYFNVFGPRQDPNGAYAAVIPRWLSAMRSGQQCVIYGDGATSRDFCYVSNVVEANLRSGVAVLECPASYAVNVAVGDELSLQELHTLLAAELNLQCGLTVAPPRFEAFRAGDVRRSRASVALAGKLLGYAPLVDVRKGVSLLVKSA